MILSIPLLIFSTNILVSGNTIYESILDIHKTTKFETLIMFGKCHLDNVFKELFPKIILLKETEIYSLNSIVLVLTCLENIKLDVAVKFISKLRTPKIIIFSDLPKRKVF